MATLASLVVRITGNTASLNKSVKQAETRMGKFKKGANKAFGALKVAGPAAAVAAGAAVAGFAIGAIKNFADVGDELDKMSKRTGFSVESLSALKFAAEQSGASIETIEKAAKRMSVSILDASRGSKDAADSLDAIGLSAKQLEGLSPEQQFDMMAKGLAGVQDSSKRAALAQKLFGRAGTELLPLFTQGEKGMAALRQQAEELGVVMSGESAASAADFKDALNEGKSALQGLAFGFAKEVIPAITDFLRAITPDAVNVLKVLVRFLIGTLKPTFTVISGAIKIVAALLDGDFSKAWEGVRTIALGVMQKIAQGWNNTVGRIPGIAQIDMAKIEEALMGADNAAQSASDTMEELATTTEGLGTVAANAAPLVEDLAEAAETLQDRIDVWHTKQEILRTGVGDLNEAVVTGLLPTLEDLPPKIDPVVDKIALWHEKQEALRTGVMVLGESIRGTLPTLAELEQALLDQAQATEALNDETVIWVTSVETELPHVVDAYGEVWQEAYRMAVEHERALERMTASWNRFELEQDSTIAAMMQSGVDFGDLVEELANRNGVSTLDMAAQMKDLGITYGDTMALIEHFGRTAIDGIIGDIDKMVESARAAEDALRRFESGKGTIIRQQQGKNQDFFRTVQDGMGNIVGVVTNRQSLVPPNLDVPVSVVPGLAAGGTVMRGGAAMVGERGPELVSLPRGAQVHPSGSGGGGEVHNHWYVLTREEWEEAVNRARLAWERAG